MDEEVDPKNCPFCGWEAHLRMWGEKARVECPNNNCPVQPVGKYQYTATRAIAVWNLRRRSRWA
jgi:hypothetical protein